MEYIIGNKKLQIVYNIEEEITPSKIILRYIPHQINKQMFSKKPKLKNTDTNSLEKENLHKKNKNLIPKKEKEKEIKLKKHYLLL